MTRQHTERPVWTWTCDRCHLSSGDLAFNQRDLPSPEEMRARGWDIADLFGDRCAACVALEEAEASSTRTANAVPGEVRTKGGTAMSTTIAIQTDHDLILAEADRHCLETEYRDEELIVTRGEETAQIRFSEDGDIAALTINGVRPGADFPIELLRGWMTR